MAKAQQMAYQERLQDLTERYLKALISEVSGRLSSNFDSFAPFGELGIDSFYVLKIIKRLEADFGVLPKSLLFENFHINGLAKYFAAKHTETLSTKFAKQLESSGSFDSAGDRPSKLAGPIEAVEPLQTTGPNALTAEAAAEPRPVRILESEACKHPEFAELVKGLFERYKYEGTVSRGTRKIAPNLFIGSARRGYFNYGRSRNILLVYSYSGPQDYFPVLLEEMHRYSETAGLQLNILNDKELQPVVGKSFSATPFGAIQRIVGLREFSLEGGAMRRLRYQVSKFEKSGACKTEEYRCGSSVETDQSIVRVIERWCEGKTMVNPLVHDVKGEILNRTLSSEHRLFLTYLDGVLQNVILITAMSSEQNGYLMDLEFYPPDMPMGGLEFAIVKIIEILAAEGSEVLSLGGTYGCKIEVSANADPEVDKILEELRERKIFNDESNLQFKNKFRPITRPILLCRPTGSGEADNVLDIIMMIADPEKMQTPDADSPTSSAVRSGLEKPIEVVEKPIEVKNEQLPIDANDRSEILSRFGFNPLKIPQEHIDFDLKTDSWAQLDMPAIQGQMKHLQAQLQRPVSVDDSLRAVFPFAHFVLTGSGQEAEHLFFKAWSKRGLIPQNLLFPSTILHQIDNGFTPKELPHPAIFQLNSQECYKGNIALEALETQVAQDPAAIACVCIELSNNAAGGHPVSFEHLRRVKALLREHSIPLVIDGTRVIGNARFLIEQEREHHGASIWTVVREILCCADAVIGSLSKEFCVNKGGVIATNDLQFFLRLQELIQEEGSGIDPIEKKLIALSLQNRKQIETRVLRRSESVRLIWQALKEHHVPVVHPAGGHCVLIDVKQIGEFRNLKDPVASLLAWLYLTTGIRAAAHSVGMQKETCLNGLIRLAIPVGLRREQIDDLIDRLTHAFLDKRNIPEIIREGVAPQALGGVHANYRLEKYHTVSCDHSDRAGSPVTLVTAPEALSSSETAAVADAPPESLPARVPDDPTEHRTADVAIVGMAGRYPKAKNLVELWDNLKYGRDCIEEIPPCRYERRLQYGSAAKYRGGFIDDVDKFDSLFFNISPREAEMLDPQERLFLEVAWEAIEDAGYYPETLTEEGAARNIGVFVGAVWAMYQIVGAEQTLSGNRHAPNSFLWSIANRVSYWMNLSGPSLTVDTACSSSLTAIYLACEAIRSGECSAAIVGGVNLDLHQAKLDINQNGGALSNDGVCRSFGKGANGYVAGEGVGALFLKPLDRAIQDRDHIYGVIKGAVINHGGRTGGYFVPNPAAQAAVITSALRKANIEAGTIGYIEAHGTGTELGDPVEIAGLSNAFNASNVRNQSCAIGSIKSNIGHLEAAAGVVSISKVLLQMKNRQLVPSLHSAELNEFIDFEHSPFYVVQRLEEWKRRQLDDFELPLRAGISSFGAGGSNAHVILESYEPHEEPKEESSRPGQLVIPLSARSADQLRVSAARLKAFLEQHRVDLADVAYTLQEGRKSFEHRLAIIAGTQEELVEKLTCFADGKKAEDVVIGDVRQLESVTRLLNRNEKKGLFRLLSADCNLRKIAGLWAEGLFADWHGSSLQGSGKRISLPTYPFAGKRHWIGEPTGTGKAIQQLKSVHPLVDTNESTFERQIFKKTFHERDFFIHDHFVANIPTLPGVAYLELARKAGEVAAGRPVRKIQNILWVSPITVENSTPKEVFIELKPNGDAVQFEVFSETPEGSKKLHSQGRLRYATRQDGGSEPQFLDLNAIRARCTKRIDGSTAYPIFQSHGLTLGPSFQVLQEVYKNDSEALGVLKLPEFRHDDLQSMILHPSLVDGSLQAGMTARLADDVGEMLVPFSIGEVEILSPLQSTCFSYTTEARDDKKDSRVLKSNVLIVDETGKVLAKIRESTGVPLRDVHQKSENNGEESGFAKLYYSYEWEETPPSTEEVKPTAIESIVLFSPDEELRDLYEAQLREKAALSAQIILVRPGEKFQKVADQSYVINPRNKDDFERVFESLLPGNSGISDVCFAWPLAQVESRDENLLQQSLYNGVHSFLFLCQSLVKFKLEGKIQLLYVYATRLDQRQPHNEAVGGFIRTLLGEYPRLLSKALEIRVENDGYRSILDALWTEHCSRREDAAVIRYEKQMRSVRKLKAFDLYSGSASPSERPMLRERGVYLITGGIGGLGLIFAEFLAKEYKAKLILTGRSSLPAEQESHLNKLRDCGGEVLYVPADVSNREAVRRLIDKSKAQFGEINGIIHSAGIVRDSYIRNKTVAEMNAVFATKVHGTRYLDELTGNDELDFFVMFSSLAAVTGNPGQCDYSFANHFMDSFAAERERLRLKGERFGKTLSINWSLWADGGMRPDEQTQLYLRKSLGMRPLSTATGVQAFVQGLRMERVQFAVLEGVAEKLELAWAGKKKYPVAASAPSAASIQAMEPNPEEQNGSLDAWLQEELSQIVTQFLKLDAGDVARDKILLDLGFDSIGLTTFANAINDKFQLDITPILFFDYPSIAEIAKYLSVERKGELLRFYRRSSNASEFLSRAGVTEQQSKPANIDGHAVETLEIKKQWKAAAVDSEPMPGGGFSAELRFVNTPIAIVGMSGAMPQSEDLDEFWKNLKNSRDLITVIPPDRWRWEDYYGDPLKEVNKSNSKWGGFMKEVDKFDPLFFGISPREAQMMDPQQRIFLEHVWKAVEDSGQRVSELAGSKTGVFVGVATNDYLEVITGQGVVLDGYSASGNSHSVLANRVSFLLGLRGPSAPIDTACSSSLVALHRAIESIHTGSSDMAIVGGVQVMLSPAAYISFGMAGMLSGDGKCKTFDKRANGYVRGEGCGAIFLKTLRAAEADGNHIYAIIKATAENHGGRVTALTAPNSVAQAELLIEAYEKGHVDPATVGYIECHGTGTSLGDPIEIQALTKAFSELYKKHRKTLLDTPHCALSSVKTNIGHLETAAGIAGLFKALLAIRNAQIPANIHLEELNPYINLKGTPFYIADKLTPWQRPVDENGTPVPRTAGVSSFGFGGANAHVVLEEYVAPERRNLAGLRDPQLIVLSAKNSDRLEAYIQSTYSWLEKAEVELIDLAFTLQVGRDEMPERLALVVSSAEELKHKLERLLTTNEMPEGSYRNRVGKVETKGQATDAAATPSFVQSLMESKDLSKLAALWVSGTKIEWRSLYRSGLPRRISGPTYPFARERHWVRANEGSMVKGIANAGTTAEVRLHPLIHRNVSTFEEQKFSSVFSGEEFYFADHVVETQKILPGVAYLEMARAAGELSGHENVRIIRNLVWERPLIVERDAKEVQVSLVPSKGDVTFAVKSVAGNSLITHCTGKLGYSRGISEPETVDVERIRERCPQPIVSRRDLYPFLSNVGLKLGKSFQIVDSIYANKSESLAILELPEHLKKDAGLFWLHPALMDGSLHTAIGLLKANGIEAPLGLPYSIGEVQILQPLTELYYGYASWTFDEKAKPDAQKVNFCLLDKKGNVLVRVKDFISKPLHRDVAQAAVRSRQDQPASAAAREAIQPTLETLVPVWNPVQLGASNRVVLPKSSTILLLGGDQAQLDWVQRAYPCTQRVELACTSSVEVIEKKLGERSFDQLLWIAPDVNADASFRNDEELIVEKQEEGVLAVFRIIKALQRLGYANKKLQWTLVTGRTQAVGELESIQATHAGIIGLVGSLAKECPHWDIRLLDLESLAAVSVEECLSLPWDKQGNPLVHRSGQWSGPTLARVIMPPEVTPAYRKNGVYVVVGGAGGVGAVWSRYLIERYQANLIWIGRRESNADIQAKIDALSQFGPAPLYISADATNWVELEQARRTVLEAFPSIHGVVHSAIVLRDQSLFRMDEPGFRASLSAKVDVSVNLDRVFGKEELDFMLFFSSIISVVKSPGQSNYAAGCTFKDSFARKLERERCYPVKIMNWGYWGNVGVVADESYNKVMQQMGIGSIEPAEGMASLQVLLGSELPQVAVLKTLRSEAAAGFNPTEVITYYPKTTSRMIPKLPQTVISHACV